MTICFKDQTFCASPNCTNECGRKITPELQREYEEANLPNDWNGMLGVSYAYFCGEPNNDEKPSRTDSKNNL